MVSTAIILTIGGGVTSILPYQCYAVDLIINNLCIMLSFVVLDYQYTKCCIRCIYLQEYCCSNKFDDEIQIHPMKPDLHKIKSTTESVNLSTHKPVSPRATSLNISLNFNETQFSDTELDDNKENQMRTPNSIHESKPITPKGNESPKYINKGGYDVPTSPGKRGKKKRKINFNIATDNPSETDF